MCHTRFTEQRQGRLDDPERGTYLASIRCRPRREPEVSTKQLVGSIQQVEQHEDEVTPEDDLWDEVAERLASIRSKVRGHFREEESPTEPSKDEIKQALRTLGSAVERGADAVGDAFRDPEMKEEIRKLGSSLVAAFGAAFREIGEELRRDRATPEPPNE